jgi:hypothetical protein
MMAITTSSSSSVKPLTRRVALESLPCLFSFMSVQPLRYIRIESVRIAWIIDGTSGQLARARTPPSGIAVCAPAARRFFRRTSGTAQLSNARSSVTVKHC